LSGTFELYAAYYDLLYADKGYEEEADFLVDLMAKEAPGARTLLELGCGTGGHALPLLRRGYSVCGIDRSPGMVEGARERFRAAGFPEAELALGDVRTARLDRKFDVVLSLFHVVSYQTTQADILATFQTAAAHLNAGGVFVFDAWYGPAVLSERPGVRIRRKENDKLKVLRLSEPALRPTENLVDVKFTIQATEAATGRLTEFEELHTMRYLFVPEVAAALDSAGFDLARASEWLTGAELSLTSWNAGFVAVKR
jgi:SAM-dependent methyltransferase